MELVPATLAVLAVQDDGEDALRALQGAGRRLGDTVEVDLGLLEAAGHDELADKVRFYFELCEGFWVAYEAGRNTGPYVAVQRELTRAQQRNTKTEKKDLVAHLEALESIPGLAEVVQQLTEAVVDLEKVTELGAPFQAKVAQEGAWTTATLVVEGAHAWPLELGGPASHAEVRRIITLRTSQAAWRDRRNRRLAEVAVVAEEIWPDPQP